MLSLMMQMNGILHHENIIILIIIRAQIKIPIVLMKSSDASQFLSYANLHSFDEIRRFADSNSGKTSHSAEL